MKVNWKIHKVELIVKCLVQLGAENNYICFFPILKLRIFQAVQHRQTVEKAGHSTEKTIGYSCASTCTLYFGPVYACHNRHTTNCSVQRQYANTREAVCEQPSERFAVPCGGYV